MKTFPLQDLPEPRKRSLFAQRRGSVILALAVILSVALPPTVDAQVYVLEQNNTNFTSSIEEYSISGADMATIVPNMSLGDGMVISGNDLFVSNIYTNSISEYTTSGQLVNSSYITGLSSPGALAISGTTLYVANSGTNSVGEYSLTNSQGQYTTSGTAVNTRLLYDTVLPGADGGPNYGLAAPKSFALSSAGLYIGSNGYDAVNAYYYPTQTSPAVYDPYYVNEGVNVPTAMASDGTNLFVALINDDGNGQHSIAEYSPSGSTTITNASFINDPGVAITMTLSGTDLLVGNANGTIGEYTTAGGVVNASLISGITKNIGAIVVAGPASAVTPTSSTTNNVTNFSSVPAFTGTGGYATTVKLLAGTSTGSNVTLGTTTLAAGPPTPPGTEQNLASDIVQISGNDGDIFAAQLTFNLNAANEIGGASNMVLLYVDPTKNIWENAVLGDHGTNTILSGELDFQGSFAAFQAKYGTDLTLYLGAYGVDASTDTVWAVIDHNSDFAAGDVVPEPSTDAMLGLGLMGLFGMAMRRKFKI